ncbi:MAG: hypothetical protein JNL70_11725 [Saprospiraceae bacterium]|nr:hypothetical protein [Saprospiraceae bacterium]
MVATATSIDAQTYKNLIKLCPNLAKLTEGEFMILATKNKTAPEIVIGCKSRETEAFAAIYEIQSIHNDTKIYTSVEVSHEDKSASVMLYETIRNGRKTLTEPTTEGQFQDLLNMLNNLDRKGYKPKDSLHQSVLSRG